MSLIPHKTLRSRATDQEALAERARKLFTIPPELTPAQVNALSAGCKTTLTVTPPVLYKLVAGSFVLQKPQSDLTVTERFGILDCLGLANGIKLVFVTGVSTTEATVEVEFFNRNYLKTIVDKFTAESPGDPSIGRRIFPISGGHRVPAGAATGQVHVTKIAKSADFDAPNSTKPTTLVLTIAPVGDYSTYTLSVDTSVFPNANPVVLDPVFSEIDFKFRPGCFNINCAPDWTPGEQPPDEPAIDYLAKDYDSFRHTMIAAMMQRVPEWQTSSEADLDQVLLDLFSAAADELSDYQDRVMNEAYLASARKRVSLARHARLMDYHIHQGNQASTWLALQIAPGQSGDLPGGLQAWTGADPDWESAAVFLTRDTVHVDALLNGMGLYSWSGAIPSLAAGASTADLKVTGGTKLNADAVVAMVQSGQVGQLLIQEWKNPATGGVADVDPTKRQ